MECSEVCGSARERVAPDGVVPGACDRVTAGDRPARTVERLPPEAER